MTLPTVVLLRQLARARLRRLAFGVASMIAIAALASAAGGLAVAAGIIVTAERLGMVAALLVWSGGLLLLALTLGGGVMLSRRRRRLRELERAAAAPLADPGATLLSDLAFRAGVNAAGALPPLAVAAAAFVIGSMIARRR